MRNVPLYLLLFRCFGAVVPLAEPALSPDRKEIAFVSGGDIWTVPLAGGEARLLVSHSAYESRPLYSPDGKRLAFQSNRDGTTNLYLLELATGEVRRLTGSDGAEILDNWSRDGKHIYFSSSAGDIAGMRDIWRVRADGGTPEKVSADRYASEFHAAPTPDGKRLLFVARGVGAMQWWRKGRSHLDESEIWILDEAAQVKDQMLLGQGAKQLWPQWMPDGKSFYFVSDRKNGQQNIHLYTMGKGERVVTSFTGGRVLFPNLSYDGKTLVFERDFGIWMLDTATGKTERVPVTLRGAPSGPGVAERVTVSAFGAMDVSPDGKKLAMTARGEVWAAAAKEGGEAFRVTQSADADGQPVWSPDSTQLLFTSDSDGARRIQLYDFAKRETRAVTKGGGVHFNPVWAPDGKRFAYMADGKEIRVASVVDGSEKVIYAGTVLRNEGTLAWSPDGEWLAAAVPGVNNFLNVWLLKADGGTRQQVSWLANSYGGDVTWTPDGAAVLFTTFQRTEPRKIAMVELKPGAPEFREDEFRGLFAKAGNGEKKAPKTELVPHGLRDRLRLLPLGIDASGPRVSPDGKTLLFIGTVAGQANLYTYSMEKNPKTPPAHRQITSTGAQKSSAVWSGDGKSVLWLEAGRVQTADLATRQPRTVTVTAELAEPFDAKKMAVFRQAWSTLRDNFYDPKFHGADWTGEVKRIYEEAVGGTRTQEEMRRVLNLMVGELNASHLGVGGAPAGDGVFGRLGLDWSVDGGRLRVDEVVPKGPAERAGGIAVGDVITAINGTALGVDVNAEFLLDRQVGREVELSLATGKKVRVRPVSTAEEKKLRYEAWTAERRAMVDKLSGGRLGYLHMIDMGEGSLEQLTRDLDASAHGKDGMVVDVRNNNGGFVNAYALDILARRNYLGMQARGEVAASGRARLGQRTIDKPTVLLTNQHSLSDAEDFTEGYRALGLGKIVGEPTAGWIIYTSGRVLLDGSVLRVPSTRVTTAKGEDMELRPRPVDIPVSRPMGESYRGVDIQMETAVKALLSSLPPARP